MKLTKTELEFLIGMLKNHLSDDERRLIYTNDVDLEQGEKHGLNRNIQRYVAIITKLESEVTE